MIKQMRKALDLNKKDLLAIPNVVGMGIGYKTVGMKRTKDLAIVVLVEKKLPLSLLVENQIIPRSLESIPTDVIEVGEIRLLTPTDKVRPVQPGVSIGHYKVSAGTFGAVVKDIKTKQKMILSNNHVLANATDGRDQRSQIGDPILQPGTYDGGRMEDQFAVLERFVPLLREVEEPACSIANGFCKTVNWLLKFIRPDYKIKVSKKVRNENFVDCALAKPLSEDLIIDEIMGIGEIEGINQAEVGMEVRKSGRTSGVTEGKVITVGVVLRVAIGQSDHVVFKDQVVTDMKSQPGDSGALVLDKENKAVGLLFAGSSNITVFNRIQNIMRILEVEL